ncbi:hypothetical protein H8B06_11870 [Sphingobacterium sp. DN00404]|uniref:Uncharacterized protein n=1 Tax=Sphingobacterium micropteri TaxID=2763501 RepID=A0ABR7YQC2_9SPHI|nr:hypothetical protein [Sphingobacterium micropteri]MBD1433529.1 hypothetical protein [Sphingobacterium micropteri]
MGATRENYENLLTLFEKVCRTVPNSNGILDNIKKEISIAIKKIKQFHLFDLRFSDEFFLVLESPTTDFNEAQRILTKELYVCLGELLYTFETANPRIEYSKILELSRIELPFEICSNWNLAEKDNGQFSMDTLFFSLNKRWLNLKTEAEYLAYRKKLQEEKIEKIKKTKDAPISKRQFEDIKEYFERRINEYRDFIQKQYPEITDEFTAFNSSIRVYIIPQKKSDSDIINQVNIYKNYDNNKVFIYPDYIDFASRFSNLEEIERKIDAGYMGLFNESDIDKYGHHFSKKDIFQELHQIFIKKANFNDLRDYLVYLLRGQKTRVYFSDDDKILKIDKGKDTKCKLFFDSIPNLELLKQQLKKETEGNYEYVAFKVRPDKETINYLEENSIEFFILEYLGREQVNIDNGEMVHWFIKDRIKNISYKTTNDDYSTGDNLLKRLENCPHGTNGWLEYENLCTEIFSFLFKDDFRNYTYRTQSYTHDNIFRRDLIINNNYVDSTGIWAQVKSDFSCNLIVIDFKNYSSPLEQNEFYLPSKYLNLVIGKFGIIFSRKGLGNSAKILQRRMFNRDKELILCLDDTDLKEMIREKMLGQDPTYRLENQKFLMYELE